MPGRFGEHRQTDPRRDGRQFGDAPREISGGLRMPIVADHVQEQPAGRCHHPGLPGLEIVKWGGSRDHDAEAGRQRDPPGTEKGMGRAVAIRIGEHQDGRNRDGMCGDCRQNPDIDDARGPGTSEEAERHAVGQLMPEQADITQLDRNPGGIPLLGLPAGAAPGQGDPADPLETRRQNQRNAKDQ